MEHLFNNRRIRSASLVALMGLGCFAGIAAADCQLQLEGSKEVPPVQTTATGTGEIKVHNNGTVTGSVTTTGIEGTAAHIHSGAIGVNGPPVITLTKKGDTWSAPPNAKLTEAQQQSFENGELYVNVHSAAYPNGEIRDQLASSSDHKAASSGYKAASSDKGHCPTGKGTSLKGKEHTSGE